jgi:WD40 repeat protein
VTSVAFSPDGSTIVSGSADETIKVWGVRPFLDSEWEEVDISGMSKDEDGDVKIEGSGYTKKNYWRNKVTGDNEKERPSEGAPSRHDQSLGCRYLSPPYSSPTPKISAPTLATASLELKAEKQSAHSKDVTSVAFSPDGSTIVSGSFDQTIKVWDAVNFRAHVESEWETFDKEVNVSQWGEPKMEIQTSWRNIITGHEQGVKPSGGVHMPIEPTETIKVLDAGTLARHIPHPAQR